MTDATTMTVSTENDAISTGLTLSSGTTTVTQNEDIGNGTEAGNTSPMIRIRFFYLKFFPIYGGAFDAIYCYRIVLQR